MRYRSFLTALALAAVTLGGSTRSAAQGNADTLRYGLFRTSRETPAAFVRGGWVSQTYEVRTGPDSAPASTANADSVLLPSAALSGYAFSIDITGTASASNAKSVVLTFTGAGATTTIDSLQMKTGGGKWRARCMIVVRNPVVTSDSTQIVYCNHVGSADSSTTSGATGLTQRVKFLPSATTNKLAIHNATGTAKGDVVVEAWIVEALPGGRVNQ